jgi:hypothetical protein
MSSSRPLLALLPLLLPLAVTWVGAQEEKILSHGIVLTPLQLQDAKRAGVSLPEKIRLLLVDEVPVPLHPILNTIARETVLIGKTTAGMTLRYGIYIRKDVQLDRELHVHEFVHVGQYERLGSIEAFLRDYLKECIDPGYPLGPMEGEAIDGARRIVGGG